MSAKTETFKINMIEEEVEKDLTRTDVVELLLNNVATVTFTKADGTERVMECSLSAEVFNKIDKFKFDKDKEEESQKHLQLPNLDTIAVWDIPSDAWRSFRMDSVKSISIPTQV